MPTIQRRPGHECIMVQANAGYYSWIVQPEPVRAQVFRSWNLHLQHSTEDWSPGCREHIEAYRTRPAANLGYGSRGTIAARLAAATNSAMTWLSSTVCAHTHTRLQLQGGKAKGGAQARFWAAVHLRHEVLAHCHDQLLLAVAHVGQLVEPPVAVQCRSVQLVEVYSLRAPLDILR